MQSYGIIEKMYGISFKTWKKYTSLKLQLFSSIPTASDFWDGSIRPYQSKYRLLGEKAV
jgi:hypothetical protein